MSDPRGTDNLLTSLKVISRVQQHERLATGNEVVRVEKLDQSWYSYMLPLRRWYSGESRETNIQSVGRIIDNAFSQLRLYADKNKSTSEKLFVLRLTQDLEGTITGLKNLQTTYTNDSVAQARIDLLIERVSTQLDEFKNKDEDKKLKPPPSKHDDY